MLKTCRRGGVSITLPSLKKKKNKNNFPKKKSSTPGIVPGLPGPEASVLTTELFRLWKTAGRKSMYVQTTASRDMSSEYRFAWNETCMTWRHDVFKAGNETCFRINCLLAEVTHVIFWSNRYDRVDKYPLYWIPGCRYAVQWFNCLPGHLRHDTWQCRGFFCFFINKISPTYKPSNRRYKKWV